MTTTRVDPGFRLRLAEAMAARGVSKHKLTKEAKLPDGSIYRFLNGDRGVPGPQTLHRMAQALGVDPTWLSTGMGSSGLPRGAKGDSSPPPPSSSRTFATSEHFVPEPLRRRAKAGLSEPDNDEPYPNRALALIAVGEDLDQAVVSYLLRLSAAEYAALSVAEWVGLARETQRQIRAWKREIREDDNSKAG